MTSLLLLVAIWLPFVAGVRFLESEPDGAGRSGGKGGRPFPILTTIAVGLVLAGLVVQVAWSPWLADLERNRHAIASGQWWRLATSLVAQDGWVAGGVSNAAALAFLGTTAEWVLGRRLWLLAAAAGVVGGQTAAMVMDVSGAGNSIVVVGLAAALSVRVVRTSPDRVGRMLALVALLASAVLVGVRDLHGFAALAGAVVGLAATPTSDRLPPAGAAASG